MGCGDARGSGALSCSSVTTLRPLSGNPQAYVQLKAGHSQDTITERYIHAAQVLFPGAASCGEERMFGEVGSKSGSN
jgi:hypothetical protein